MFGALDPDGEKYEKCRMTMLGTPANAVLYTRHKEERQWIVVDRLTGAKVIDNPDGTMTLSGISDELVHTVGMPPSDATVRWEVTPRGCADCG